MIRLRALQISLGLAGVALVCGTYPLIMSFLHPGDISPPDQMILAIYISLGIFLLLAVRHPAKHRSLILFAGWSTLAHMAVMILQALRNVNGSNEGDLPSLILIAGFGVLLLVLAPAKEKA
ncbi:MAG: hypothetical protein C5B54_10145 [Acidobacteria bacterium]|nr:MAG: hypothetical protein C5B54_10145 [Acidobacteriota bacterium]